MFPHKKIEGNYGNLLIGSSFYERRVPNEKTESMTAKCCVKEYFFSRVCEIYIYIFSENVAARDIPPKIFLSRITLEILG